MRIPLKQIVLRRLFELNLPPITAATAQGFERSFVYDLVLDKKQSVRADKLPLLASAIYADAAGLSEGRLVRIAAPQGTEGLAAGATNPDFQNYLNDMDEKAIASDEDWWGLHPLSADESQLKGLKGRKSVVWDDWKRFNEDYQASRVPTEEEFAEIDDLPPLIGSFDPDEWTMQTDFDGEAYSRENYTPKTPGALPELDLKAGAGEGAVGEIVALPIGKHSYSGHRVVDEWPFPANFLHNSGTSPTQSIVVEVIGESMLPTYLPGDRVVVDLSQNRMMADGIYMWSDGHSPPQVKRLQRVPFTNPPRVSIVSDNKAYAPFEANIGDVKIFGRVTWHLGRR